MAAGVHNLGAMKIDYMAGASNFTKGTKGVQGTLEKFIDKSKQKFKQFGNAIRKSLSLKNISLGLGGLVATMGILTRQTVGYSSTLVETARVAGVGITEFEKFREVLASDGMGFDHATASMRRFAKRIGELRSMGRGAFFKGIEALSDQHPDHAEKLFQVIQDKSKNPIDVLQSMIDMASKAKMGAEEIAALFDLGLGMQGRQMGTTLINAAKEHGGDLAKAMEHYGAVISMTAEEHIKNKDLGQQFEFIGKNVKDAVRKIMSTISEPLTEVIDKFNTWLLEVKNNPKVMEGWLTAFKEILKNVKETAEAIGTIINAIASAIQWVNEWRDGEKRDDTAKGSHPLSGQTEPRDRPSTPAAPSKPSGPDPLEGLEPAAASYSSVSNQIYNRALASGMSAGIGSNMIAPMDGWLTAGTGSATRNPHPSAPALTASTASADPSLVLSTLEDLRPTVTELNSSFRAMINTMIDGTGSFRGVMDSLLDSIMQRAVVDPIADHATKGFDAFFGGLFGGGKAKGGRASGLTLVGERGPEVVDFNSPAQVYSNDQLRRSLSTGGAGKGSPTIIYNIQSSDGPGVRAALAEATPNIIAAANSQMMEETNRVGATRRIMQGGL